MKTDRFGHCFYGVNYTMPPHELPDTALADGYNVYPNDKGLIQGRGGSVVLNSNAEGVILGGHEFRSGTTRKTFAAYNSGATATLGYYSSATGNFSDQITGLTADKQWQFVNFAGKLIGVNEGSDTPQYYQTDALLGDLSVSAPNGLTIGVWANRLWFGGDATYVAKLTGSALNDPTDYTGGVGDSDSFEQTIGDSEDQITGIFPFFDTLLIGKKNNIYKLYSPDGKPTYGTELYLNPIYTKESDSAGFTSPWAITQVGNDVIFLDGFDIKRLSGIMQFGDVEFVSIIPQFREYLQATCDKDYLQYTKFFHYKQNQQLWVSMPTSATAVLLFCLDYRFIRATGGQWAVFPMGGVSPTCLFGVENGSVVDMYYGNRSGFVSQLDASGYDDGGTAIDKYFVKMVSGNLVTNDPNEANYSIHHTRKHFVGCDVYVEQENSGGVTDLDMTFSYALDLFDDAQIRTAGNYTQFADEEVDEWDGTGIKSKRLALWGASGNTLALKVRNNSVGQNFVIYPSQVTYALKSKNKLL